MAQPGAATTFPVIGRWSVTSLPAGWIYIAGFGIKQMTATPGTVAASVGVGQDKLENESGMAEYLDKQLKLIEGRLTEVKCAGPQAIAFAGADEAQLLFVRHTMASGSMLHAQTYVRVGRWLGIVTLTTLEAQLRAVRPDYDAFVRGLRIGPPGADDGAARG
jgi:hypothetical protein